MLATIVLAVSVVSAATQLPTRTERYVYDTAGVIDDGAERELEQRHQELFAKAGVAIVVVTVPRLVDETIDEFAVRLGQAWGVGKQGQDRGLVVALARDDRKIFVATGYGTEGYLPDGRVGALLDQHAVPYLQRNQFSEGIVRLATALADASAREYNVTLTGTRAHAPPVERSRGRGGIVFVILAFVVFALLARRHPMLAMFLLASGRGRHFGGGFGGGFGRGGFGGGGFGGGGAGRGF